MANNTPSDGPAKPGGAPASRAAPRESTRPAGMQNRSRPPPPINNPTYDADVISDFRFVTLHPPDGTGQQDETGTDPDAQAGGGGDASRQGPRQPRNRDASTGPSAPGPARGHGGSAGDQTNSPNQPPAAAGEGDAIWDQLRHWFQGRGLTIIIIMASVVMVTLAISVPVHVILLHSGSLPQLHHSPVTNKRGTDTGDTAWPAGPRAVTSADVIMVGPARGHGPPAAGPAKVEPAGPTPATGPLSVDTEEVSGGSAHTITFGDESGAGKLRSARGVAVSPDNKIWVADQTKTRLQVYGMAGAFLYQFPQLGAPGLAKKLSDVSIDRDGHLWVLMNGYPASPDSLVQLDREGHSKAKFDLPDNVPRGVHRGMAVGLRINHVYVTWSNGYSGGVQAFQPDGKVVWGVGPQQRMKAPIHVAVDGEGNILVSDFDTHHIYVYDNAGQYVRKLGGPGLRGGYLNRPQGICADSSGHILVVDSSNQRVVVYTGRGRYVRHIAVRARSPTGVAVGPGGQLVVINKNTITVFPRY
ncbi:PREDICTED: uncharacterized protein LOC109480416 [Branchiostoma belcheri]|uniref:Uncharacterized protein LOC109480416 n=1 Tax=Branchiostoma belcheri TaxID=7741 RepID=A0A6P5A8U4_BRABE|nr:PREDICTED: uncharacterized protein LOC109480416 [Branchiostoma belcheri]